MEKIMKGNFPVAIKANMIESLMYRHDILYFYCIRETLKTNMNCIRENNRVLKEKIQQNNEGKELRNIYSHKKRRKIRKNLSLKQNKRKPE